ncbi:ATP-binding protein [Streptosporangium sp. NBC_01755]|uniref:ATP-binding protein n=1 Tax=unclassified Streptosporangium TaxID=2632669 RepID=UPI002DDC4740|nr:MULTISPECIES: ATP-binding protein [unclassified Streptosporangium]WSA29613.1 ATP-binding protein [Streptosporangium sp. NBC_01810]WSD04249.1 ATP-binding protein [Streptosporangium sp. NBC_01755]
MRRRCDLSHRCVHFVRELAGAFQTGARLESGPDTRDLVTIVGNLMDNAAEAAMAGTRPARVEVRLRTDETAFVISVADSGLGLDPTTAIGVSRVTARRYLEHLTENGITRRVPQYGGVGRPELLYQVV